MKYNIEHLTNAFYQFLCADDAVELQDSYQGIGKESISLSHDFFNIRHIIETRFDRKEGYCLTVWGVQMYKALQKRLRQAPITIFTSIFNDKDENQFLQDTLGAPYYRFLKTKSKYISLLNRFDYNRYCVIKALDEVYYFEFDLPSLQLHKKSVNTSETDIDLQALKELLNKTQSKDNRAALYEGFLYIYNRSETDIKNCTQEERNFIRLFYKNGVTMPLLSRLFRRSTETIHSAIHQKSKTDKE